MCQSTHNGDSRRRKKWVENIFEKIMAGNFPNLKETDIKMQEEQKAPNKLNPNRPTPKHIIKWEKLKIRRGF